MEYYHNLITQNSWNELTILRRKLDFILIGGWAVYLYTKQLKSKDIDIIIDFEQLPILEKNYQLAKNDRLTKYEARKDDIEIDIYLPHYSRLGIPVEDLRQQARKLEGFKVLKIDYLLALKIYTLGERGRSAKGRKDFIDIISLLVAQPESWTEAKKIVDQYAMKKQLQLFYDLLKENSQIPELAINAHRLAKIKQATRLIN